MLTLDPSEGWEKLSRIWLMEMSQVELTDKTVETNLSTTWSEWETLRIAWMANIGCQLTTSRIN